MSQPYVGEIRMFGGNFAPAGWLLCQGQILPISDYDTLFNLIGTTYGGDGQSTFALPNLQSRVPLHTGTLNTGQNFPIGQTAGEETVTLTIQQITSHTHIPQALASSGSQSSPQNNLWAQSSLDQFSTGSPNEAMASAAIGMTGGSQPHDNMIPYLAINFIISLFGVYPSQT